MLKKKRIAAEVYFYYVKKGLKLKEKKTFLGRPKKWANLLEKEKVRSFGKKISRILRYL